MKPTGSSLTSLSSFSSSSSSLPSFRVSRSCDRNQVRPDRLDVLENVEAWYLIFLIFVVESDEK